MVWLRMARRRLFLLSSGSFSKTCLSMPMASGLKLRKTSKRSCSVFSSARVSAGFSAGVSWVAAAVVSAVVMMKNYEIGSRREG